jgi:predicted RNA-binding protein YlxR (DUF448 family)
VSPGPVRTCIGCRSARPAAELVRTARTADGGLRLDRRAPGRGAWLCRDATGAPQTTCVEQAARKKAFDRALRAPVAPAAVAGLRATPAERARMDDGAVVDAAPSGRD